MMMLLLLLLLLLNRNQIRGLFVHSHDECRILSAMIIIFLYHEKYCDVYDMHIERNILLFQIYSFHCCLL